MTTTQSNESTVDEGPPVAKDEADAKMLRRIYLNDHRTGATGAKAMVERMIASNEGTPLGETLLGIRHELDEDAKALETVMRHLHATPNPAKNLAAVIGERVGRLKMNGRLRGYSPLSRVLEIEGLMAAIDMKRRLWESLQILAGADELGGIDLARYMRRADDQRERLLTHHEEAVNAAFTPKPRG